MSQTARKLSSRFAYSWLALALILAACGPLTAEVVQAEPTATLLPIVSQTPRFTATPVPSNTPLPTFTYTPSDTPVPDTPTLSPTPTLTPTISGIVQSLQRVNVREGPSIDSAAFDSVAPGTGVTILGQNLEGDWYQVQLEDGTEGWIAARLLFLQPSPTPFPTFTPGPDQTALALGTPLPTAIIGGGTVTPTPPRAVRTATPPAERTEDPDGTPDPTATDEPLVPVIDVNAINQTATALVRNAATATPSNTPAQSPTPEAPEDPDSREIELDPVDTVAPGATSDPDATDDPEDPEDAGPLPRGEANSPDNVDVFAFCDDVAAYGIPAPATLREGQTIDIWWGWFAREEQQVQDHIDAAIYDLRVNGQPIENVNQYRTLIGPSNADYVAYWYVPYGPLEAGEYEITYAVSWERQISDGYGFYGPDTSVPFEQETCTFTVREVPED